MKLFYRSLLLQWNKNLKNLILKALLFYLSLLLFSGCIVEADDEPIGDTPQCAIPEDGKRSFWVWNLKMKNYDCIQAELKKENNGLTGQGESWSYKVYINSDNAAIKINMSDTMLSQIKVKLDSIVPKTISVFGTPLEPVHLEDPAIIFLITDIIENEPCTGCYTAGFYDPANNSATYPHSNRVNMLIMDGVQPFEKPDRIPDFYNTLAHELQHIIHYKHDQEEETWLDEGLAEMASDINRETTERSLFDPDIGEYCTNFSSFYNCQITDLTPLSLLGWESTTDHYYKTALFFKYLCEKQGDNCLNTLYNIISNTNDGISSIEKALEQKASLTALDTNISDFETLKTDLPATEFPNFSVLFQSWAVAMSQTAYNNNMGKNNIAIGSLDNKLNKHQYTSFDSSYPYWEVNKTNPITTLTYSYFEPFTLKYILWDSVAHGPNSFDNDGFESINVITIAKDGTVDFSPDSNGLNGFFGMQILYNIYPNYDLSGPPDNQVASNTDSTGSEITVTVTAKVLGTQVLSILGKIISIGNVPFTEISIRDAENGKTYALSGNLVNTIEDYLGYLLLVKGEFTDKLSRREQRIFEVSDFEIQ